MTKHRLVTVLLLAMAMGACEEGLLDVLPVDEIAEEIAIVDAGSATAALMGAYSALQSGSLYGGDYLMWTETLTDNVEHTGTFGSYGDGDLLFMRPEMGVITGIWGASYSGINRVNLIIEKVPAIDGMDPDDRDMILGQAYGLRALFYFNLARAWGGVPLVLTPPANLEEAAQVSRASLAETYAQVNADLAQAGTMLAGTGNSDRTLITPGFVTALEARVALYQEQWATAQARAQSLINSGDYDLVTNLRSMFTADGGATAEDILRVSFTAVDWQNLGYYYMYDGRFEIGATQEIYDLFDGTGDLRFDLNFDGTRPDGIQVVKFPTPIGAEDPHVIRYADIILISAEALAEQDQFPAAVTQLNLVHERAGLAPYTWGTDLTTKAELLDAIYLERRLELAFEGEYWFDLCRTGTAAAALGSLFAAHECLWPIPVSEMDVAPNLVQNSGY